ncbi:MAG: hypothetical protein ACR2OE_01750 [Thermomicrobiales bacterium]
MTERPQDSEAFWQELRQTLERLKEDSNAWRRLMDELPIIERRDDPDPYYTPEEIEEILRESRACVRYKERVDAGMKVAYVEPDFPGQDTFR